jgi:hypothetical protein
VAARASARFRPGWPNYSPARTLQQFLPAAELILYPDANHGAHFQYHELFVRHARIFLDDQATPDNP